MKKKYNIKKGEKYGKWVILDNHVRHIKPSGAITYLNLCKCECGKESLRESITLFKSTLKGCFSWWRKQIFQRDSFKCKIDNSDCKGQLEAHHILSWREFPELRFDINNGITLCHAHHPRKRAEEKRSIPTFKELVSVSKVGLF